MMDDSSKLFDPMSVLVSNGRPLQHPGRDRLVRTATVAGPEMSGDRRVYLNLETLEACLRVARASQTGRCMLDRAGIKVDLYETKDGHQYEVWQLLGVGPKPEPLPGSLRAGG